MPRKTLRRLGRRLEQDDDGVGSPVAGLLWPRIAIVILTALLGINEATAGLQCSWQ